MFMKSIRWRLQVWMAFLLLVLLSGFGITAYQLNRVSRFRQLDEELERRVALVSADVRARLPFPRPMPGPPIDWNAGPPPSPGPPRLDLPRRDPGEPRRVEMDRVIRNVQLSDRTAGLFDESDTNAFYYAMWSPQSDVLKQSSNAPPGLRMPERLERDTSIHIRTLASLREAYHFTELGECILVGRAVTGELTALRRFAWVLFGVGAIVLAVGLGGGWVVATGALRPVEQIGATAGRISSGNLSERIDLTETDGELGRLAGVLNSTFARLEAAFAQQRQFTADASHELRTPLAVMITEAQTTLARERSAAEYRDTVAACLQTAQQMRRLTDSLMRLARFDTGQEIMARGPVNLAQVASESIERIRPLAEQKRLKLSATLNPVVASGDMDRIGQVATNLLSNAVQFNREGGSVDILTRMEHGMPVMEVRDTGQGIGPEDLPHIFERFYRADKSRSRSDGHVGLGLAICKAIVEAHGGAIAVASQRGVGTTFTVRLPPGQA